MFSHPDWFSTVPRASSLVFMLCVPRLIFDGTEDVKCCLHVLRFRTSFWRNRGRRVPFSCFALPDSFSTVPRTSGPVCLFCAPGLVFSGTEGAGSRYHFLCSQAHFGRSRGHRVQFSCFVLPTSFGAVLRASGPDFMFCAPRLVFGGIDSVESHFLILRSRTHFGQYRGRRV
jgi:hypothetical protein